ncbi:hypothetical protein GUITHDRAFT_145100 [Guillardia theta CCMP2712]|uniref:Uncharacterized protein n=1 Tax=Guillardia theta (strain CCMP2712) TaxID=905079 RepID=L1ILW6_GUITC|nr:hypothetical protein GUITHDRAFT_145100 [Guillardia theta CCMP2712]EKX37258.1 hypothetical protein GUITHDRAFT_145100 [Guillardia theta CCMP2712]|eukprot:XP_005824238.1 hypothetical protein GUITHDRAFT_145100 [Guillardia theta CCMP2712]
MKELERMQEKHVDDLYELLDGSSHKIDFTSLSRLQNDPTFLSSRIASDIHNKIEKYFLSLIQTMVRYSTIRITPLMICRVLHGISSPSCRRDIGVSIFAEYWGKMYNVDWNLIHICSSKVLNEPELIKALNGTRSLMLNEQATETRLKMIQECKKLVLSC